MENLYYILWTNLAIFASFVVFVVTVTVHIVKKKKPTLISCIIIIFCLVGIYLFVPARYLYLGCAFQSPEMLEKSVKLSIIPYEKRLAYLYMSDIYNYDIFHEGRKDGNKAIIYLELAANHEITPSKASCRNLGRLFLGVYPNCSDFKNTNASKALYYLKKAKSLGRNDVDDLIEKAERMLQAQ